jgi:hypothetical protein
MRLKKRHNANLGWNDRIRKLLGQVAPGGVFIWDHGSNSGSVSGFVFSQKKHKFGEFYDPKWINSSDIPVPIRTSYLPESLESQSIVHFKENF